MLKSLLTTYYNAKSQKKLGSKPPSSEELNPESEYLVKSIEALTNIIKRRTENGKKFGKLEITAPSEIENLNQSIVVAAAAEPETINYFVSVLLDNSGSMSSSEKIVHAIDTIINLLEVLLAEKQGKTTPTRKIHTWFCLMIFNDSAKVVVPFQELNDETFKSIRERVQRITTSGSTSYEAAFKCQSTYLSEIMQSENSFVVTTETETTTPPTQKMPKQVHIVKIFETDGDITAGTSCPDRLYAAMHEQPIPHESYKNTIFSYEDIVIGYGVDVKTKCLKMLASPKSPQMQGLLNVPYNCSSFISIAEPGDIGWQVGEMLFKLLTRYGAQLRIEIVEAKKQETQVVVEAEAADAEQEDAQEDAQAHAAVELFEYQTHTWSETTTLHSIALNETKTVFIQIENGVTEFTNAIEVTDQIKCQTFKYKFNHAVPQHVVLTSSTEEDEDEEAIADAEKLSMILAMLQLEIFKLMREIEADVSIYDNDILVSETYKMIRILKDLKEGKIFRIQESKADEEHEPFAMSPQLMWMENLIADAKVLIGLTTIAAKNEQLAIIHARRTSSAEHDFFSTGQRAIKTYIEGEEYQEIEARAAIEAEKKKKQEGVHEEEPNHDEEEYECPEIETDNIPTRVVTCMPPHQQKQWEQNRYGQSIKPNHLRTLCGRIALAKENKEEYDISEIIRQIRNGRDGIEYHRQRLAAAAAATGSGGQYQDETFSSIPDDVYSSMRVNMMRQMSTPTSSDK